MDKFDDLTNIKEIIEPKPKQKVILSEKEAFSKIDSLEMCFDTITKSIDNLSNHNENLNNSIKNKGNEISKNMEILLKKLEDDTNNHLKIIENSNLTEDEKKDEYIKCLEELDKISLLSQALENCVEISEENFLKFLEKPFLFDKDNLIDFIINDEENLKKSNVYNELVNDKQYLENLYNDAKAPYLKNYLSHSGLLTKEAPELYELKINENSDISNVKELLIILSKKNETNQDIKKISLKKILKGDIDYLFEENTNFKASEQKSSNKSLNLAINSDPKNPKKLSISEKESEILDSNIDTKNFTNISFSNCDCTSIDLEGKFPKLKKLKLTSCQIPFFFLEKQIKQEKFEYFDNITELYLENCNIVDESFREIYYSFLKNQSLKNNLKVLSFKNNKISVVSVYIYFMTGEKSSAQFLKLEFLDLSNNNINFINIDLFQSLPEVQVVDFSNNNIQFKEKIDDFYNVMKIRKSKEKKAKEAMNSINLKAKTMSSKEIMDSLSDEIPRTNNGPIKKIRIEYLFQIAGNIAINRVKDLEKYCKYLIETIPKIDFPIRSLNFSGIFHNKTLHQYLFQLDLSKFKNSLVELDLSLCNLTDDEVSKLLNKELQLKNLKKLNLAYNKLTDNLFKLLIENNSHEIFDKLKVLDLSNNDIHFSKTKEIKKFVKLFDNIQKILIYDTPIEEKINNYIRTKIIRFIEEQNYKKITTEFNNEDLQIKELLENKDSEENLGNQSDVKLYMNNVLDLNFKKLKIKENADIGNYNELLIFLNNKNDIMSENIMKISLKNMSKEKIENLFNNELIEIQRGKNMIINKISQIKFMDRWNILAKDYSKEPSVNNNQEFNYNYPYIEYKKCDCTKIDFDEKFPKLEVLKLNSCELPFFFIEKQINEEKFNYFPNVTELYLENCNIVDESFNEIFYSFLKNESLRKNLKVLSFKKNKISIISVYMYFLTGEKSKFKFLNLQSLDLSNNNINYINVDLFECLPAVQVINFSNNNILFKEKIDGFYDFIKKRKGKAKEAEMDKDGKNNKKIQVDCLFQVAGNIAINKEKELEKYCKYLIDTVPKIDFPLRSLNLYGIFHNKNLHQYLFQLDLSKFNNSLVEIDLSFCNLTDDEVCKLLQKEVLPKNLKKLNLSYNEITDNLFKLLTENNSKKIYDNLKVLDLSNNDIHLAKIKEIKDFIKSFDFIKKILIYNTPVEKIINNYIKKKIIRLNEEKGKKAITTEFNKEELNIIELLENKENPDENSENKSKVKLYMNNNIDYRFVEVSKKLYPKLFDRISIKNIYNYSC